MKRMHVHVAVEDIKHSIGFYSALFAARPSVIKSDYAKWMLDDPRVNFAISTRGRQPGLDHLGIQVEDSEELQEVYARLRMAGGASLSRDRLLAATRDPKSRGSMIPQASPGKPFLLPARAPIMVMARESGCRALLM